MSMSINIKGYINKNNLEFKKHFEIVKFCIEKDVSFPIETTDFFKGKINNLDLEDYKRDCIIGYIEYGININILYKTIDNKKVINIKDLPKNLETIIISYE